MDENLVCDIVRGFLRRQSAINFIDVHGTDTIDHPYDWISERFWMVFYKVIP